MKGLLKTAVLLVIFCATAMACGGGGEDALDHKGGDGGGTGNKGDQEEPEQPFVAHITPIDKLNQGELSDVFTIGRECTKICQT